MTIIVQHIRSEIANITQCLRRSTVEKYSLGRKGQRSSRPQVYAGEHAAEGIGIRLYGIPEGNEQPDDLRAVRVKKEYYVDTVGKNKQRSAEYVLNQLGKDKMDEQMTMFGKDDDPFKGGRQQNGPSLTDDK